MIRVTNNTKVKIIDDMVQTINIVTVKLFTKILFRRENVYIEPLSLYEEEVVNNPIILN